MDILGIGLWEILLILGLAFVILGPQDLASLGRKAGSILRKWIMSDEFREIKRTKDALTNIPAQMMREAGLDKNSISPWAVPGAASAAVEEISGPAKEPSLTNLDAPNPETEAMSAWANPGGSPVQKRKAMLDDVKLVSARKKETPQADQLPQTDPTPPQPDNP